MHNPMRVGGVGRAFYTKINVEDHIIREVADLWKDLGVSARRTTRMMLDLVPNVAIMDFRFYPVYKADETLQAVIGLIVTRNYVYYARISERHFEFRTIPLSEFNVRISMTYDKHRKHQAVDLHCDVGDLNDDGTPNWHDMRMPRKYSARVLSVFATIHALRDS